ncbi:hypothetical protein BS78_05G207500 [Paspalum vaginatum]|nr:hypothetical protein BS78_05G207500 [Paspalum vaginatum]
MQSPGNGAVAGSGEEAAAGSDKVMLDMRKYVMMLAILAATVTYVAGLNPPGGVWVDTQGGHLTGDQILVVTYHTRYNAFSYSNATAFMASGVVILLLLLSIWANVSRGPLLVALRWVMVLDMLALMVAYAASASRNMLTTVLAAVLALPIFIYVMVHMLWHSFLLESLACSGEAEACSSCGGTYPAACDKCKEVKRRRKILMLLAIFAAIITYAAGLCPPGGFWPDTKDGHRAGDPVLQNRHHGRRFVAFVCNTASFVASLGVIMLLLTNRFYRRFLNERVAESTPPYVFLLISLLGLVLAYAFGSCRETASTAGVLVLYGVGLALVLIYCLCLRFKAGNRGALINSRRENNDHGSVGLVGNGPGEARRMAPDVPPTGLQVQVARTLGGSDGVPVLVRFRSVVQLLAILGVTVTYAAGLNPPGGFWPDDRGGHKGGDPILLTMNATRYRVFLYSN